MNKVDHRKSLREFYGASSRRVLRVSVPAMNFLMIDGQGSPGDSEAYQQALEALFPVAYTIKFGIRNSNAALDYRVLPLEGLWWADDMQDFVAGNRDRWKWTMMIMQPEFVTAHMVAVALGQVRDKKAPPALENVRFERFEEGQAAQILHVGPFDNEGPTIEVLHRFIEQEGGELTGRHHEIYLSDVRRAAPDKLRTIIRQPYR